MAFPVSGFIKIFPDQVQIISGHWALNSDATPQPDRPVADLQAYYDTRVTNVAVAPNIRRNVEYPAASGVYVPAVDDYELQFSSSTRGLQFFDGAYPSPVVATLDYLSADFPLGMTVNQLQIWWTGQQLFGPNRDRTINSIVLKYFGSIVETYTPGVGLLNGSHATPSNAIVSSLVNWSPIRAFKPFGFRVPVANTVSANLGTPRSVNSESFILAVYNTQRFDLTNSTPLAVPGEIADITNAQDNFDIFTEFKIYWDTNTDLGEVDGDIPGLTGGVVIPTRYFFILTSGRIRFQIPEDLGIPYGGRRLILMGVGDGVQFVGEFEIAQFNILLVDGSGVYQLTKGQRHDTYYDRSVTPPVTTNLKFPRTGARTGFF